MTLRNGFTFGDWTVHPLEGRLVCDDDEQRIQPKSMDVLLCLASAGGTVVERDKLLLEVWGERAPSDEPLTRCIGELRRALGESGAESTYILTVPKRGYRLLRPVAPLHSENAAAGDEATPKLSESQSQKRLGTVKKVIVAVAVLLLAAVLEVSIERALDQRDAEAPLESAIIDNSIAVLPFANMSLNEEQEYFSDGISEELLILLARVPNLRVISRSSAFSYKGKNVDVQTIAKQLRVSHILEGSVRWSGERVRITAQLIDTRSDTSIWSEVYERSFDDIFATQEAIAREVVEQLRIEMLGEAPTMQAADPEAYALVLQARHIGRQFSPGALDKSVELFEQAIMVDPNYAAAWAGLSRGYRRQASQGLRTYDEAYALARQAANRALELDPYNAAAHRGLAFIARNYDRDLESAAQHYGRALELDPSDAATFSGAASMAESLGRIDQAIALAQFATARDPVSPVTNTYLGLAYLHGERPDQAISSFRTTLALSPNYLGIQHLIGLALLQKGALEEALAATLVEQDEGYRLIGEALIYHAMGRDAEADNTLAELIEKYEHDAAYNIAFVFAYRDEADRTFEWLQKAVEYNDTGLSEVLTDPLFANVRSDARWLPFLESIGKSPDLLAAIEFDVLPTTEANP